MTSSTPCTGTLLSNERRRQSRVESCSCYRSFSGTINRERSRLTRAQSGGYERWQNPLPSFSGRAPVGLTTTGSQSTPKQLSDEPSIGWVVAVGTGESRGEKGSPIRPYWSLVFTALRGERGRGWAVRQAGCAPCLHWLAATVMGAAGSQ